MTLSKEVEAQILEESICILQIIQKGIAYRIGDEPIQFQLPAYLNSKSIPIKHQITFIALLEKNKCLKVLRVAVGGDQRKYEVLPYPDEINKVLKLNENNLSILRREQQSSKSNTDVEVSLKLTKVGQNLNLVLDDKVHLIRQLTYDLAPDQLTNFLTNHPDEKFTLQELKVKNELSQLKQCNDLNDLIHKLKLPTLAKDYLFPKCTKTQILLLSEVHIPQEHAKLIVRNLPSN